MPLRDSFRFNKQQLKVLSGWPVSLKGYLLSEWRHAVIGYTTGALVGAVFLIITTNRASLSRIWVPNLITDHSIVFAPQRPYYWFALGPAIASLILLAGKVIWRSGKSWIFGVASGSFFLPLVIASWSFSRYAPQSGRQGMISLGAVCSAMLISFGARLGGAIYSERTVTANKLQPRSLPKSAFIVRDPAAPIQYLEEDRLARSAFVEALALRALISKDPVIAVRGNFGDGKSSTLNMLRQQIGNNAIVVSFSTWLPDTQKALASDLLRDIGAEVRKEFVVPSLRKRLRDFATLLSGGTPYLKSLVDVLPPYTQREEIGALATLLERLPKRVIVLLDEIDRMQKDEVLMLLKIIRGTSTIPNLTFICAFQEKQLETTVSGNDDATSHEFMEKFFPVGIDLPKLSPDLLWPELKEFILKTFDDLEWFDVVQQRDEFVANLDEFCKTPFLQVCTNVRKIAMLAGDIQFAAKLAKKEVNALDLCVLEAIRRFYPKVYETIWTNCSYFTNSSQWWKSMSYKSKDLVEEERHRVSETIKGVASDTDDHGALMALIRYTFPDRAGELSNGQLVKEDERGSNLLEAEKAKRISHPDYFPIYFCRAVPESIFSSFEMEQLKAALRGSSTDGQRQGIFSKTLSSLARDSLKQYDFVHKVGLAMADLPIDIARSVALGIALNADKFGDEFLVSESRRALGGVFVVAERLAGSDEVNLFLSDCIGLATTDSFAANIYRYMTTNRERNRVITDFASVDNSQLERAFIRRMNERYGADRDISTLRLSRRDIFSFSLWTQTNEDERAKEVSFWQRYIGRDRRRLADVFALIAPADTFWTKDSPDFIDQLIPREVMREMNDQADDFQVEPERQESLRRLNKFLENPSMQGEVLP